MNKRMKWLVGTLAIVYAVALYSVYIVNFEKHSDSHSKVDDNWEKYWNEYYFSVELALDALQARHDGRTNDFESLLAVDLFDESLRKAIRFYDNNGYQAKADKILKVYIYRCVVDQAADPRPPGSTPFDTKMIDLFRRIAAIQPTVSDILVDPEIEALVAKYTEQSILENEVFVNQPSTNEQIPERKNSNSDYGGVRVSPENSK